MANETNPLKLRSIHHVELWVGNARQAAYFYRQALGFSQIAYAGLETGSRDVTSYALKQGKAMLVLSTPLGTSGPVTDHIRKHGDAVRDIAFVVENADAAFTESVRRGAKPLVEPRDLRDDHGVVRHAAIATYGDTIHSLLSFTDYKGPFLPGFQPSEMPGRDAGLLRIDHIVGNVELGKMNEWADFYASVCGFHRYINFDDKDISTEYSALMSIVMSDDSQSVKFPINEPAEGRRRSQIQEYLDYNGGPGVQHIAIQTKDILSTVAKLRQNGIDFLDVPDTYYDRLPERVGDIAEDLEAIRKLRILVDRDEEGYLLQLFTKPVEDRPTLFFEIIQRAGSRGFGKGNFRALFESIEAEQARRGNL
ncbi:MAG: 4-hydroxyphenylpyruvate dioxygenase [Bryobacteraceae bacterium]|nr:4-hydroxyphenylpyruvate dioxygenase [Bryobacteraceae bacterium]